MNEPQRSPLHEAHLALNARMAPFAGWEMPIQYEGIVAEHLAVRKSAGVFDISHMGQVRFTGEGTGDWLNGLLTNNIQKLAIGEGQYTLMLNERGGVIDDLIVYRTGDEEFYLVINASMIAEDVAWLEQQLEPGSIRLENLSAASGGIAVQGPDSKAVFAQMAGADATLPPRFCIGTVSTDHGEIIVCRTGYTGEDGFELFSPAEAITTWWQRALDAGAKPAGLGARDTLRLEKCYPLNGSDLSPDHTPLEAGLGMFVDLEKDDFMGRDVLAQQKAEGIPNRLVALVPTSKGPPPRHGYTVWAGDEQVGEVTSGGLSPSLGKGIALALVSNGNHKIGTGLELDIRGKRHPAEIVRKPFL